MTHAQPAPTSTRRWGIGTGGDRAACTCSKHGPETRGCSPWTDVRTRRSCSTSGLECSRETCGYSPVSTCAPIAYGQSDLPVTAARVALLHVRTTISAAAISSTAVATLTTLGAVASNVSDLTALVALCTRRAALVAAIASWTTAGRGPGLGAVSGQVTLLTAVVAGRSSLRWALAGLVTGLAAYGLNVSIPRASK